MVTNQALYPEYLIAGSVVFIAVALMLWYWRRRSISGRFYLALIALATAWWGSFYLLEISQPDPIVKLIMEDLEYFAALSLPALMLLFVLDYIRFSLKPLQRALIWLEPVLMLTIVWTDGLTHWLRTSWTVGLTSGGPVGLTAVYGWAYWVNVVYSMLVLLGCCVLMLRELLVTPYLGRLRTGFVLIAGAFTLIVMAFVIPTGISANQTYLLLAGAILSQLVVMAGVLQRPNLELIPIAREAVLEQMRDPVIVVNLEGEISAANPAAMALPGLTKGKVTGRRLSSLGDEWEILSLSSRMDENLHREIKFTTKGGLRYYDVVVSPIKDNKQVSAGSLIVMRETTQQILAQNELAILRRLSEEFNQAADLKSAIRPAMETIRQLTDCATVLIELVDSNGAFAKAYLYNPDNETKPFSEIAQNTIEIYRRDRKYLAIPLAVSGNTLGVVNLFCRSGSPAPEDSLLHLIHTICNSLSVTVERIRLFEVEHNQREQAETLQNISRIITSSLDFNEVLDLLLEQVEQLVRYDAANIMWVDGPVVRVSRSRGYEKFNPNALEELAKLEFVIEDTENVRTIISGQTSLVVPDTTRSSTWKETHLKLPMHSWLGAPVVIEGTVVAIFALEKVEVNAFTENDANRLSAFAIQAGLSIQNSRLFEAEKKRIRELEGLQATLTDISGELNLDQLLQKIVSRAINLLDASVAELGLYDKAADDLQIVVSMNLQPDTKGLRIGMGEGLMGEVAKTREPKAVQYYSEWAASKTDAVTAESHAGLAVPMMAGSELVGVLGVGGLPPNREYSDEEMRLLNLFAQQATVAIHNARLYDIATRQAAESETLRKASSAIASTLNLEESLNRILEQLATVVPYDSASVSLVRNDQLEIVGGLGFADPGKILGAKIELNRSNPGAVVFLDNKPLILKDSMAEYADIGVISGTTIKSWLGVPLNFQERTIGILSLDSSKPNQFDEDMARMIQAFADQVSIALENVTLYEKALKAANRFEILYKLSQEINANLSQDQVCNAIHRAASSLMLTECFMISELDEANHVIIDLYMVDQGAPIPLQNRPASQGLFARVIADGISRKYDTFDETMILKTGAILLGDDDDDSITQSILCVPLRLGSKIKGVISVQSYLPHQYSQEDLEMLELLAGQGAIALENSRLFGEVQQLAITDPLTLLYNRRRFFELAEQEFERSARYMRPLSVIMLDIDHFKRVNDTYGHYVGDQVLQHLADICLKNIRQIDILARYGGEEFVILMPETDAADALVSCERLRSAVCSESFNTTRGPIPVSISLGVVDLEIPCKSLEELLDRSDQALYESKNSGRNRTSIWNIADSLPQHPADSQGFAAR